MKWYQLFLILAIVSIAPTLTEGQAYLTYLAYGGISAICLIKKI